MILSNTLSFYILLSGSMFPWESALTGVEVCPGEVYGKNQNHNSGDIAFAVKQYWMATGDVDWMLKYGIELVFGTAKFWASRVEFDKAKNHYIINDVMPPDEYQYPVNNSVYTNVVAKINLEFATYLGQRFGKPTPSKWQEIASKMFIPYDEKLRYHPEFEGFDITSKSAYVKQADVILTGFPLMYQMEDDVRENDLRMYAKITDPDGPAMTHSMFTIGWLELGDEAQAEKEFKKNFDQVQDPFKIWTEVRHGRGESNFITAAGGYLQSIIFGYGGLRLRETELSFHLHNLPGDKLLTLDGVKYMGNSLRFEGTSDGGGVVTLLKDEGADLKISYDGKTETLSLNKPVYVKSRRGKIMV